MLIPSEKSGIADNILHLTTDQEVSQQFFVLALAQKAKGFSL